MSSSLLVSTQKCIFTDLKMPTWPENFKFCKSKRSQTHGNPWEIENALLATIILTERVQSVLSTACFIVVQPYQTSVHIRSTLLSWEHELTPITIRPSLYHLCRKSPLYHLNHMQGHAITCCHGVRWHLYNTEHTWSIIFPKKSTVTILIVSQIPFYFLHPC